MANYRIHRIQIKTKVDSLMEILLKYLKDKDGELSEKERLLQALSAFWLPLALVESGQFSEKEIAIYGLAAILRLKQQITHLSSLLSLHAPSYSHLFIANLVQNSTLPKASEKDSRAHVRGEAQVKSYTELDGLDDNSVPETQDVQEDFDDDFPFLKDTTNKMDKIFGG